MRFAVHVEVDNNARMRPHEENAARLLADYFESDIVFLRSRQSKNPDLYILKTNIRWEIKSPTGKSKYTVQNNLREASRQSQNIILDLHRIGLTEEQAISRTKEYIRKEHHSIKRLKILTKSGRVIDIIGKG